MMFGSIKLQELSYQPGMMINPSSWAPASAPVAAGDRVLRFGRCSISVARRELFVGDELRPLQPQPFDVLIHLIEQRERVVRIDELLDRLWANEFVQPGTVASTVARIRKAIADDGGSEAIRTYHRVGYRFVAPLFLG